MAQFSYLSHALCKRSNSCLYDIVCLILFFHVFSPETRSFPISLQFNHPKVWQEDFEGKLRIRFFTHHSKCSQCLRHRLIIKRLSHCPPARRAQHEALQKHLARQYRDRQVYWSSRAISRLSATTLGECQICCIVDSMDAQKHAWPRSRSMSSKEFASFNRPRLASTSLIFHGFSVTLALSPHTTSTNSSRTSELLAFGLSRLASKVDFRKVFLSVQADNCSKELKNQTNLRLMAMWVALHKLGGGELSFLSSGHSHEDIDAMFNLLRAWIESHREIWTPTAFQQCLQGFLDCKHHRVYEPLRNVILMTRFRDWPLGLGLGTVSFFQLQGLKVICLCNSVARMSVTL